MKLVLAILAACALLTACDQSPTSTQIERRKQEELSMQAVTQVGMPAITNFAEKRMMKDILELRDQNVATTTYITDMNGKLHKLCNSIGYGLPYATQYTNPQRVTYDSAHGSAVIPQADPNGLYSPASADGTWVLCVDAKGKARPVYVEPHVIVSPMPLGE
jgi:hypothetical protein